VLNGCKTEMLEISRREATSVRTFLFFHPESLVAGPLSFVFPRALRLESKLFEYSFDSGKLKIKWMPVG
jgi:hypothetical protein